MTAMPTVMHFGAGRIISPDGSDQIPADLWPELELMILLEPVPSELKAWERRLEDRLGVTEQDRTLAATPWYILRACTRREKQACASLTEMGIEHFMPTERVLRKLNRDPKPYDRALFPGYLFARVPDKHYHAATHANGVHAAVMTYNGAGERVPRRVPARLIRDLREAQDRGDFDRTRKPPLRPGDRIIITDGPFEGRLGELLKIKSGNRLQILLEGYGKTTLPAELAEAA